MSFLRKLAKVRAGILLKFVYRFVVIKLSFRRYSYTVAVAGMALGFFNLGPGTRMFGQIGVPSIFWGSQNLGDPQREKEYVLNYEKERVTNLELILTHMHRTGRQRLFLEPLHSFLDKNSVNERAPFPRVYASLVSSLRSNEQ